jgi:hypothetical protein
MATQEQLDLRRKWVEALRSGRYQKSTGTLNIRGGYCCLGVACDILDPEQTMHPWRQSAYPPNCIRDAFGLSTTEGLFTGTGGVHKSLASLNDGGNSFAEIADIIESNPPGLFID